VGVLSLDAQPAARTNPANSTQAIPTFQSVFDLMSSSVACPPDLQPWIVDAGLPGKVP
jgi:hypothetical protein